MTNLAAKPATPKEARPAETPNCGVSKTAFIRSLPITLSASEVVARAKAAGIELKSGLVYEVRGIERRAHEAPRAGPQPAPLTPKQAAYLDFIQSYIEAYGTGPTWREMQAFFHVTPPPVQQIVIELERKGYITREPGKARSIRVVQRVPQADTAG